MPAGEALYHPEDPIVAEVIAKAREKLSDFCPNGVTLNEASMRLTVIATEAMMGLYGCILEQSGPANAKKALDSFARTIGSQVEASFGQKLHITVAWREEASDGQG